LGRLLIRHGLAALARAEDLGGAPGQLRQELDRGADVEH
jgi:hypothetical protein